MGFSLSHSFQAFAVVAVVALSSCDAFVPNQRAFGAFQAKTLVTSNVYESSVASIPRKTRLAMVIDQFVAGRDGATRKKETDKYLEGVQKRVNRINELEATIEDLDDDELQAKTKEFKERLAKGEDINGPILEEAFAVVREAAWYVLESYCRCRRRPRRCQNPGWTSHFGSCSLPVGASWSSVTMMSNLLVV